MYQALLIDPDDCKLGRRLEADRARRANSGAVEKARGMGREREVRGIRTSNVPITTTSQIDTSPGLNTTGSIQFSIELFEFLIL